MLLPHVAKQANIESDPCNAEALKQTSRPVCSEGVQKKDTIKKPQLRHFPVHKQSVIQLKYSLHKLQ